MATLNQDFTKFLEDTFVLQFNITDSSTELNNYSAFWSCQKIDGRDKFANTLAIVKTTSGDFADSGSIGYQSYNIFNVYISQSDFISKTSQGGTANVAADLVTGSYYHELTIEPQSGEDSVVIARGTMTLVDALFPDSYR